MINRLFSVISLIFLLCGAVESADIKLILFPKITAENNLLLGDIALIDSDRSDIKQIKKINIECEIYSDGYIDKKEILSILKSYTEESISIYGNAVRVINNSSNDITIVDHDELFLKKGDRVEVVVNNKGISLVLKGIAVNDGKLNDEITVRITNKLTMKKFIKAKIIGRERVEVNI
ncbi:MAG: flagella basal body P-ring formation protein FlgA [Spirochaetes bacterium]|nr:flagella basal body P-ring formation protein FlgA [Spirochaetota bacterium]